VTVLGHSAGGQLAFWLAGIGKSTMWSQFQVDTFPLRAAISLAGVLDMRKASELGVGSGSIERLMGGTPDRLRERYANVSPIELLPFDLPHLAIHGVNDGLVPLSMSEGFHQVAGELNSNSSLLTLPGVGHFELIDPRSEIFGQVTSAVVALTA
jgi:pimeloyl-ACP methyl ester carboxylesterase